MGTIIYHGNLKRTYTNMTQPLKLFTTVASAALFAGLTSHAVDYTWVGGTGSWTDANAWSFNGGTEFFTATDGTIGSGNTFTINSGSVSFTALSGGNGGLFVEGTGALTLTGNLSSPRHDFTFSMADDASVTMARFALATNVNTGRSQALFDGGTLTLTDSNPITGSTFPNRFVNITADAGAFSIVHSDSTEAGKTLATKVGSDLFSIDGTNPLLGPDLGRITVTETGSDVSALNLELATVVKNGKYLQIVEGVNTQTLVVVPEPSTYALLAGVAGLLVALRRRV